jgi:soluble lytic murein transglycosylase-like protein
VVVLSSPRGRVVAGAVVGTVVVLVAVAAFFGLRGDPRPAANQVPAAATPGDSPSAVGSPTSEVTESPSPPSPTPSPKAAATPAKKKAPPPKPKPVQVAQPPPPRPVNPPPKSPAPGASCPTYTGPVAPRADVASAIGAAANRPFKPTLSLDDHNPPAITVRLQVIQGVAWEESGWQSTIVSCDGGVGTMQVMKDTADWMNVKYGTTYDFHTLTGNVMVGTGYLAWLTRYFGDRYFNGSYSLAGDPNKLVLLDLVISGYQAGYGAVDNAMAAGKDLPNTWYVYTVEGFMTSQPWTG